MKKLKLFTIALGVGFVAVINSGCSKNSTSLDDGTVRAASTAPTVYAGKVSIEEGAYNPSELVIVESGTVLWTNNDNAVHTVTFDNGMASSGDIQPTGTFAYTFNTKGVYSYHCKYHPKATGVIRAVVK